MKITDQYNVYRAIFSLKTLFRLYSFVGIHTCLQNFFSFFNNSIFFKVTLSKIKNSPGNISPDEFFTYFYKIITTFFISSPTIHKNSHYIFNFFQKPEYKIYPQHKANHRNNSANGSNNCIAKQGN